MASSDLLDVARVLTTPQTLTLAEFWQLRGLFDGRTDAEVADLLGVTVRQMCDCIHPGVDEATMGKVRERLRAAKVRKT